ncbi:MAG: competence protein ComEA [Acidobacteriota bacterium]|jgi:competence protein ComEA|nr:competence protein ComEA [Acidobacteriota bacterium]
MRKSLQFFALALIILAVTVPAHAADAETAAAPAPTATGVVNLNTADAAQLALLPRVGEKAAQRIIEYRTQHGPFKKTSDLMQVKGFGEKSYERISRYLAVDGRTTLTAKVKLPGKPRAKKPTTPAS